MKQKRIIKSLIPNKTERDSTLLTVLLLILSVILCLGSASLMTVSVGAAADDDFDMKYLGNDDRDEVLYGLQFVDPESLGDDPVNELYIENDSLYISPNQVIFKGTGSENEVDTGKFINVLGGEGNEVNSDAITIIAGYKDIVDASNDGSSILGGDENELRGTSTGDHPAVLAGGMRNKIVNNYDDVIVGGENNQILGSSGSFILGGEDNEIIGGENIIIGGENVKVDGNIKNIFAFSNEDSDFEPESSNAFYLNLTNGVGISVDATKKGVSVSGAVGFGNIDAENIECDEESIGVEGEWEGCLVGCTDVSMNENYRWELLDRGSFCEEKCNSNSDWCLFRPIDTGLLEDLDYTGFCATDHIDITNATRCTTGENESYENVVFEGILIDHEEECPVTGNNKCVYRCNPDAHLTGDVAGGSDTVMCYSDCRLPWDQTKKIKHNETIVGYNIENVSCSNDVFVFPLNTEIINKPVATYTIGTKIVGGVTYNNRDKNGTHETCGSHDHKKTLICSSGTLYLLKDGKADLTTKTQAEKYKYENCDLHDYRCDTGVFILTQQQIMEEKEDAPRNGNWVIADRTATLQGNRGQYKLCIDYNANPDNPTRNGESCVTNTVTPTPYHYQFVQCQNGYTLYSGVCRKDCTLKKSNGANQTYHHADVVTGYQAASATCTGTCQAATLVCNDNTWRIGALDGEQTTQYQYNYCTLNDKVCEGRYSIEASIVNNYGQNSIYNYCDPYSGNGIFECVKQSTLYELVGCSGDYHTENGHESRNKWCISNTKYINCDKPAGKYGGPGKYMDADVLVQWQGGWNEGHWSTPLECEWKCDEGYHLEGNDCVANFKIDNCSHGEKPLNSHYIESGVMVWWLNGSWTSPDACLWSCNDEYLDINHQTCERMDGHLTVVKETTSSPANGQSYVLGETIKYKITVENNGNVPITNIVVTDDKTEGEWTIDRLTPAESKVFDDVVYVVAEEDIINGEVVNVATARGTSPDPTAPEVPVIPGETSDPTDDPRPSLSVEMRTTSEPPEDGYVLGDTITYRITVTNDGNLTINDVVVKDELTNNEWTGFTLEPGESTGFTTSYVVTEDDIIAGSVRNSATADGGNESDEPTDPGDDEVEDPTEDPSKYFGITTGTTSSPVNGVSYKVGETLHYVVNVKNGNKAVSNFIFRNNLTSEEILGNLAPNETRTISRDYTVRCEDKEKLREDGWFIIRVEGTTSNGIVFGLAPLVSKNLFDFSSC